MIRLVGVNKSYHMGGTALHVLRDIDLHIREGEFVAIMGSSGSGKSTLLNILGILDGYDSGTYTLGDTPIKDLSERRAATLRNRHIGFVFQSFNLLPFKTAVENVALPLYYQKVPRRQPRARLYPRASVLHLAGGDVHHAGAKHADQVRRRRIVVAGIF